MCCNLIMQLHHVFYSIILFTKVTWMLGEREKSSVIHYPMLLELLVKRQLCFSYQHCGTSMIEFGCTQCFKRCVVECCRVDENLGCINFFQNYFVAHKQSFIDMSSCGILFPIIYLRRSSYPKYAQIIQHYRVMHYYSSLLYSNSMG